MTYDGGIVVLPIDLVRGIRIGWALPLDLEDGRGIIPRVITGIKVNS